MHSVQVFIVVFLLTNLGNVLFFGCRSESKDFYFRPEWEEAKRAGHLTLFTAFSRDQVREAFIGAQNCRFQRV